MLSQPTGHNPHHSDAAKTAPQTARTPQFFLAQRKQLLEWLINAYKPSVAKTPDKEEQKIDPNANKKFIAELEGIINDPTVPEPNRFLAKLCHEQALAPTDGWVRIKLSIHYPNLAQVLFAHTFLDKDKNNVFTHSITERLRLKEKKEMKGGLSLDRNELIAITSLAEKNWIDEQVSYFRAILSNPEAPNNHRVHACLMLINLEFDNPENIIQRLGSLLLLLRKELYSYKRDPSRSTLGALLLSVGSFLPALTDEINKQELQDFCEELLDCVLHNDQHYSSAAPIFKAVFALQQRCQLQHLGTKLFNKQLQRLLKCFSYVIPPHVEAAIITAENASAASRVSKVADGFRKASHSFVRSLDLFHWQIDDPATAVKEFVGKLKAFLASNFIMFQSMDAGTEKTQMMAWMCRVVGNAHSAIATIAQHNPHNEDIKRVLAQHLAWLDSPIAAHTPTEEKATTTYLEAHKKYKFNFGDVVSSIIAIVVGNNDTPLTQEQIILYIKIFKYAGNLARLEKLALYFKILIAAPNHFQELLSRKFFTVVFLNINDADAEIALKIINKYLPEFRKSPAHQETVKLLQCLKYTLVAQLPEKMASTYLTKDDALPELAELLKFISSYFLPEDYDYRENNNQNIRFSVDMLMQTIICRFFPERAVADIESLLQQTVPQLLHDHSLLLTPCLSSQAIAGFLNSARAKQILPLNDHCYTHQKLTSADCYDDHVVKIPDVLIAIGKKERGLFNAILEKLKALEFFYDPPETTTDSLVKREFLDKFHYAIIAIWFKKVFPDYKPTQTAMPVAHLIQLPGTTPTKPSEVDKDQLPVAQGPSPPAP